MLLRHKLALHGFESNDDYEFSLRCLFEADLATIRVLHVDGAAGRRKTAFATALAGALEFPHVIYHDFSRAEAPPPSVPIVGDDEEPSAVEPPMSHFERAITEACAYSEGARTILILDQMQAAEFVDQIRLQRFITTGEWPSGLGVITANTSNLLIVLLSETEIYHSLARIAFRIWTDAQRAHLDYRPENFGLSTDALPLFQALNELFRRTNISPTTSEFTRLLADVLSRVRSEDHLRQVLYGRVEGVDRDLLDHRHCGTELSATIDALNHFLGYDHIELITPA